MPTFRVGMGLMSFILPPCAGVLGVAAMQLIGGMVKQISIRRSNKMKIVESLRLHAVHHLRL